MEITLYYIEGISVENEPWFDTEAHQSAFFSAHSVHILDTGFYPPHYRNRITLSLDSLRLSNEINYLSLDDYSGKTYYYFIDSIEYVSEDVVALNVTMDTIQTFLQSINVTNGIIERQFINRYNSNGTINRNYIRENFSNGDFRLQEYTYLDENIAYAFVNVTSNGNANNLDDTNIVSYRDTTDEVNPTHSPYFGMLTSLYFVPFDITFANEDFTLKDSNGKNNDTMYNAYTTFNKWSIDPENNILFIIPLFSFGTSVRRESTTRGNIFYYTSAMYDMVDDSASVHYLKPHSITTTGKPYQQWSTLATLSYGSRNTASTNLFESDYVPALIDDNYQQIYFGERQQLTTYPLYEATSPTLYLRAFANIYDGSRLYGITDDENDCKFELGSVVREDKAELLGTWNDTYTSWQANNRTTIGFAMTGYAARYLGGSINTGAAIAANIGESQAKSTLYSNTDNAAMKYYSMQSGIIRNRQLESQYAGNAVNTGSLISTAAAQYNAFFAPDSIKSLGTFYADYTSGACRIVYAKMKVTNFDYCAQMYHRIGYLVNTPINSHVVLANLFGSVRTYWQYIKMSSCEVFISQYINTRDLTSSIARRLIDGIRFWYVNYDLNTIKSGGISNYYFDNVEVEQ